MEENITQEVTTKDVLKHYLASILVYGLVLLLITFCPILNDSIENESFNYILFFLIYSSPVHLIFHSLNSLLSSLVT